MMGVEIVHTPVMPEEILDLLAPKKAGEYMIDGTLGEGGHSEAFLQRFSDLRITGIDADREIIKTARQRLGGFGDRMEFHSGWAQDFFIEFSSGTEQTQRQRPGIILLDLGVSLYHYEKGDRGFSFRETGPLDMRIDTQKGLSAADLTARLGERELADTLFFNAGERYSRRIARTIAEARRRVPIASAADLAELVWRSVPASYRHGRIHPATKTFQALRIAVNGELENLNKLLELSWAVLHPGGRLGVITFHSLEDRIVKNFFRGKAAPIQKEALLVTKKPVVPLLQEMKANPPSRSAKLRVAEKLEEV
jgi:16S rRNA (cytosine1402-N4)-methyltransferase